MGSFTNLAKEASSRNSEILAEETLPFRANQWCHKDDYSFQKTADDFREISQLITIKELSHTKPRKYLLQNIKLHCSPTAIQPDPYFTKAGIPNSHFHIWKDFT